MKQPERHVLRTLSRLVQQAQQAQQQDQRLLLARVLEQ
jgi:hypothetical protein